MTHPVVLWTARLAAACWIARWLTEEAAPADQQANAAVRSLWPVVFWTAGCGLHLWHVVSAFEYAHGWSHSAAWEHTARATEATVGLHWGGGLWLNYLFTLVWPIDVARMMIERHRDRAIVPISLVRSWNLFSLFLLFQATVVFGPRGWIGVAILAAVIAWSLRCRKLIAS